MSRIRLCFKLVHNVIEEHNWFQIRTVWSHYLFSNPSLQDIVSTDCLVWFWIQPIRKRLDVSCLLKGLNTIHPINIPPNAYMYVLSRLYHIQGPLVSGTNGS